MPGDAFAPVSSLRFSKGKYEAVFRDHYWQETGEIGIVQTKRRRACPVLWLIRVQLFGWQERYPHFEQLNFQFNS
jgi:hypothetical protein